MHDELLTAYALGELTDAQAAEVEAYLAEHPDAAAEVNAIRADAALLGAALQAEPDAPAHTQPIRLQDHPMAQPTPEPTPSPTRCATRYAPALAIAAAVTLTVVGFLAVRDEMQPTVIALNDPTTDAVPTVGHDPAVLAELNKLLALRGMTVGDLTEEQVRGVVPYVQDRLDLVERGLDPDGNERAEDSSLPFSDVPTFPGYRPDLSGVEWKATAPAEPAMADADADELGVTDRYFADFGMDAEVPASTPAPGSDLLLGGAVMRAEVARDADVDRRRGGAQPAPDDREAYAHTPSNEFIAVADAALSTFSVDVDTASYANVRRMINNGILPPVDAVRVEEFVNYFDYGYAAPALDGEHPFAAHLSVVQTPWNPATKLVRIGLKGKEIPATERPDMNLVFLLDVSGSMDNPDKLPLVKHAMQRLASTMRENDRVAIVVYSGAAGLVLDSTSDAEQVVSALQSLQAGGSTAGGAGIELAYATAEKHFIEDGVNRVILCTDGDFNVGTSDDGALVRLAEEKAKSGVYLTVLGFGSGNLNDSMLEQISNKGEGNYAYIDSEQEAERVLVDGAGGTLQAIAKDVKIQVEFNPATVASYRLIGYENRKLADRDFNDDTKDAGDIGVGHTVTALYEIVPADVDLQALANQKAELEQRIADIESFLERARLSEDGVNAMTKEIELLRKKIAGLEKMTAEPLVDDLKYQEKPAAVESAELLTVKLRYKQPDAPKEQGTSVLIEFPLEDADVSFEDADTDFKQAASAAAFAMLLRESEYAGTATLDWVIETATNAELKQLATKAKGLK